ncbi:MAG: helix-turn-helix transcriptional regulator [Clostridia bacterium]|nr:helix-turn-helix transcriptional regulator [Clostridia bacterium]
MKLYQLDKFGEDIRKIRIESNLSQADVYDIIGISQDTLRRIENGYTIPKFETLEYLSLLYKTDIVTMLSKTRIGHHYALGNITQTLNDMILNNDFSHIDKAIKFVNDTISDDNERPSDQMLLNKLFQFKALVEIIQEFNINPNSPLDKDPLVIKINRALELTISDFIMNQIDSYSLDFIEIRLLIIYCVILRLKTNYQDALITLEILLKKTENKLYYDQNYLDLLFKIHFSIAYCHHRNDNHQSVVSSCDKGLQICIEHSDYSLMHAFLFRKAVALFNLGEKEQSEQLIKQCITILKIIGNEPLAVQYKKIFDMMYFSVEE